MDINELLQSKRLEILHAAARRGFKNGRVFGSVARGEARPDSDIDFLVDMEPERTVFPPVISTEGRNLAPSG
jgi:uncharacterized protein